MSSKWCKYSWKPNHFFNRSTNIPPHCPIRHTRHILFATRQARQDSPPTANSSSCTFPYPNALEVQTTSFKAPSSEAILLFSTLKNWAISSFKTVNSFSISTLGGSKEKLCSLTPGSAAWRLNGRSQGFGSPGDSPVKLCRSLQEDTSPLIKKTELFWLNIKCHLTDFMKSWTCTKAWWDLLVSCWGFFTRKNLWVMKPGKPLMNSQNVC